MPTPDSTQPPPHAPWHVEQHETFNEKAAIFYVEGNAKHYVAVDLWLEDAERIVHAVNQHAALVAALEFALSNESHRMGGEYVKARETLEAAKQGGA